VPGAQVELLLYLYDQAFEDAAVHSLIFNLNDVRDDEWAWTAPGRRSIPDIVEHCAVANHLWAEHIFGPAARSYRDLAAQCPRDSRDAMVAWLRAGRDAFRAGVAATDDARLLEVVRSPWGTPLQRRRAIATMIEHAMYHAGEINHLRAEIRGDDRSEM
jgi:uncharacterized damage-inducible protein DinB